MLKWWLHEQCIKEFESYTDFLRRMNKTKKKDKEESGEYCYKKKDVTKNKEQLTEEDLSKTDKLQQERKIKDYVVKGYRNRFVYMYCNDWPRFKELSKGALKMYLYCAFQADYLQGYHTTTYNYIASRLKKINGKNIDKRSVYNWIKELKDNKLIIVKDHKGKKKDIYITPYNKDDDLGSATQSELIGRYKNWIHTKKRKKGSGEPFFIVHRQLMKKWDSLSLGALKLYIYSGISMNKQNGYYFKSVETIASELSSSERSIINWFKELRSNALIERFQLKVDGVAYTHILTFSKKDIRKKVPIRKANSQSDTDEGSSQSNKDEASMDTYNNERVDKNEMEKIDSYDTNEDNIDKSNIEKPREEEIEEHNFYHPDEIHEWPR